MKSLLTRRLTNSELVLRQLRHLASHLPCQLCELKGGSNIEADGGCRHRGSIDTDVFDIEVIQRVERFIRKHQANLSTCGECGDSPDGTEVA
jgi:hypothetical protein